MDALERVIIADPKGNAWGFAQAVYGHIKEIEKTRGGRNFVLRELDISEFPDGEFEVKLDSNLRQRSAIFIHDSSKEPSRWLTELLFFNDAAVRASAVGITNVLPYMRWGRGEKKNKPHVAIPMKAAANAISSSLGHVQKRRIITMDLHAKPVEGFFDFPVDTLASDCFFADYLTNDCPEKAKGYIPVAPDGGAAHRVRKFANVLSKKLNLTQGLATAIIDKDRIDGENTKIYHVLGKENLVGKRALLVDDILSSGGTLARGAEALRHYGATGVDALVTHFIGAGNYIENLKQLDRVFVSDSFYRDLSGLKNVEAVPFAPLFGEAIYAAESGESISRLFES